MRRSPLLLAFLLLAGSAAARPPLQAQELEKPVNLWPLIYQKRTPQSFELELLFSLIAYDREPERTMVAVRPFYWRERDRAENSLRLSVLWPLSDYKRVKDESRLWVLPLFWRKANPEMSRSVLFPLFSHRRDGPKTRLGVIGYTPVTLFDFQKDRDADTVRHRYILWTYRRDGDSSEASFMPFYEQSRAPGLRSYSLIPVFAYYRNRNDDSHRYSAIGLPDTYNLWEHRRRGDSYKEWHFLLAYRQRSTTTDRKVLFPVYWDLRRGPDHTQFHLWPLYSRLRKKSSDEVGTVWPLFGYRTDPEQGERELKLFWPLFRDAKGPGEYRNHRLFPLYALTSDPDAKETPKWMVPALVSPLPLLYRAAGDDYVYGRFFWLAWWADTERKKTAFVLTYYSVEDKQDGWRHRGIFPLWHTSQWDEKRVDFVFPTYVSYRDPGLLARTFFPLYYRYSTDATSWSAFVPVYFRYEAKPLTLKVLFPFYYYSKNEALRSEFWYLFPVYGRYKRGDTARSHLLFFPLYATFHDPATQYRSWDLLWPMLHSDHAPEGGSTRVLPLYWAGWDKESRFRVAFPLYWEFGGKESSQRHLLPFYGKYLRADGFSVTYGGGPLYVRISDPASQYDRRAWLFFLAGRVKDHDETRTYGFPLYWAKSSPEGGRFYLLPLGGRETSGPATTTFLLGLKKDWSLFQYSSDPTAGYRQTRALLLQTRRDPGGYSTVFFPLYWSWGGDQTTSSLLFPLYAWQTDKAQGKKALSLIGMHDGLSLFHFLRNRKEDRRLDRVLIFSRDRRGDKTATVAFPLFWHLREKDRLRSLLFPLYHYSRNDEDGQKRFGLLGVTPVFSLFTLRDDDKGYANRLWPLYGYRSGHEPGQKELGLLGFYYWVSLIHFRWSDQGYQHHFMPLYWYERTGAEQAADRKIKASLLWQVLSYRRDGPGDTDFRFLWRLVKVTRKPESSSVEVNPFYYRIVEKGKGRFWAVLGGLVGRETREDGTKRLRLLWLLNL